MSNVEHNCAEARRRWDAHLSALEERARRAQEAEAHSHVRDLTRPRFHITPPFGRLNDPNGLIYHDGRWHAFYQFTPLFPEKGVFWRHCVSWNLLDWKDCGNALAPVDFFDTHGCYSGGAIEADDGVLEFYYTGNVKDDEGRREPYQCRAISRDGARTLLKDAEPLISHIPAGYTGHFRDPDVTERDGGWMMLLGAQRENETGTIVRYDAVPGVGRRAWRFTGEIEFSDPSLSDFGYMFECPILVPLVDESTGESKDVLIFCPQGVPAKGGRFLNVDNLVYVVGKLHGTRFECEGVARELDLGFEAYAPQVFSQSEDRAVLMLWLGNPAQDGHPSLECGWVHSLSIPRELHLRDGHLCQMPVPELGERLPLAPVVLPAGGGEVDDVQHARLVVRAAVPTGALEVEFFGVDGSRVTVGLSADALTLDRSASHYAPELGAEEVGVRRRIDIPVKEERSLEVLFDGSVLEVFVDEGETVASMRAFVGSGVRARVVSKAGADVLSLQAGKLL